MSLPFRYTNDPYVDVGVATLTAAAGVATPQDLTEDQVNEFLLQVADLYINPTMSNYLGTVVFANVNFANPGLNTNPKYDAQRRSQLEVWLSVWRDGTAAFDRLDKKDRAKIELADAGERCIFSGDPAVVRVSRTLIPMTGSEDAINFVPEGRPRLPVAGWVLLALLVMPMGTLNSGGRILLAHTADHTLLQRLVERNLRANRLAFQMAQQGSLSKRPNYRFARTHLLHALLNIDYRADTRYPLTVYHFSSSGQDAKLTIHTLSSVALRFVRSARRRSAWDVIVQRAWSSSQRPDEIMMPNSKGESINDSVNYLYEDLFELPANAVAFLRHYLLRLPTTKNSPNVDRKDPRKRYSPVAEREAISWDLIEIFLSEVMHMDKSRVEAIKLLGEKIAAHIRTTNSPRVFNDLWKAGSNPDRIGSVLVRLLKEVRGEQVLFTVDDFVRVFFIDGGNVYKADWKLATDLLLIRIIELMSDDLTKELDDSVQGENEEGDEE